MIATAPEVGRVGTSRSARGDGRRCTSHAINGGGGPSRDAGCALWARRRAGRARAWWRLPAGVVGGCGLGGRGRRDDSLRGVRRRGGPPPRTSSDPATLLQTIPLTCSGSYHARSWLLRSHCSGIARERAQGSPSQRSRPRPSTSHESHATSSPEASRTLVVQRSSPGALAPCAANRPERSVSHARLQAVPSR